MSVFAVAFGTLFANASMGVAATYQAPRATETTDCTIIFSRDDTGSEDQQRQLPLNRRFEVQTACLPQPKETGCFVLYPSAADRGARTNGVSYLVQHDAVQDQLGMVWQVIARRSGSAV